MWEPGGDVLTLQGSAGKMSGTRDGRHVHGRAGEESRAARQRRGFCGTGPLQPPAWARWLAAHLGRCRSTPDLTKRRRTKNITVAQL